MLRVALELGTTTKSTLLGRPSAMNVMSVPLAVASLVSSIVPRTDRTAIPPLPW